MLNIGVAWPHSTSARVTPFWGVCGLTCCRYSHRGTLDTSSSEERYLRQRVVEVQLQGGGDVTGECDGHGRRCAGEFGRLCACPAERPSGCAIICKRTKRSSVVYIPQPCPLPFPRPALNAVLPFFGSRPSFLPTVLPFEAFRSSSLSFSPA